MRIACCVPFCRRTHKDDLHISEWICQEHWREVPTMRRKAYARMKRRWKKYGKRFDAEMCMAAWRSLKKMAIERAAGI